MISPSLERREEMEANWAPVWGRAGFQCGRDT